MKKIIGLIGVVAIMLSMTLTVFAGDVPEGLLSNDEAQVFFGEILSFSEDAEIPHISVSPVKKIKGEVLTGTKQHYERANPVGNIDVKPGNVYLITYFDENNPTYIFETTSYDTSTLKLKNTDGDMWERFEEYLNDGKYEKAEQERIDKINASLTIEGEEVSLTNLLGVDKDKCDKVVFRLNGSQEDYEIGIKDFFKLADEIRLTDVKNSIAGTDDSFTITAYDGEKTYTVWMWDNCKVESDRTAMYSAPTGDYIIKAEDYQKLASLLPDEAQPKLPPLKSLYANFVYWFIYNSTTAYVIGAMVIIVLVAIVGFTIRCKRKRKTK